MDSEKRSIFLRTLQPMREVRLDDNESAFPALDAPNLAELWCTGALRRAIGMAKIRRKQQYQPQQGRHPMVVESKPFT